jgi:renalase
MDAQEQWIVSTAEGVTETFDSVVLTTPIPQLLALGGEVQDLITQAGVRSALEAVTYSSRWAVAVEFPPEAWATADKLLWDARYVNKDEDDCVCYLSIDAKKRSPSTAADDGRGPVLVVHTGVPWGIAHYANTPLDNEPEGTRADVQAKIMAHVTPLVQELFAAHQPIASKLQKWRFSQIHKPMAEAPGAVAVSESPLMVLAGDAFIGSNFDNCHASAQKALSLLSAQYASRL